MKSAYDMLMDAPDEYEVRCKLALRAIAEDCWAEAANHYRIIARDGGTVWHREAAELAVHCQLRTSDDFSAEQLAAAVNEAMLPEVCYAALSYQELGRRIVMVKRGEAGCYLTDYDRPSLSLDEVNAMVDQLNGRLGVHAFQRDAMLAGSVFGWHVPGANAANCAELARRAKPTGNIASPA